MMSCWSVIDGWGNFNDANQKWVDQVMSPMRAGNYGVRTIVTHTSYLSKINTRWPRTCPRSASSCG